MGALCYIGDEKSYKVSGMRVFLHVAVYLSLVRLLSALSLTRFGERKNSKEIFYITSGLGLDLNLLFVSITLAYT